MRAPLICVLICAGSTAVAAEPTQHATWADFAKARRGECIGPRGTLAEPMEISAGGHTYRLHGDRLVQTDEDRDRVLRIGVISATKDERKETLNALSRMFRWLKKRRVDVLVVNGDIATHDFNMEEKLLPKLASADVLVVAHVGNTESCGQFNFAAEKVFERHENFINGNWVRKLELDDGTLVTLPGYHDRRFVHSGGAAKYDEDDLIDLKHMLQETKGPKVLVAHGPPKQRGRRAIDLATGAGNVGDPEITKLLRLSRTRFGIFGHILEAGGRGTDLSGRRARKPKRWHSSLYVNAGTANPDPWVMLDGKTGYGMALFFEIKRNKARYEVFRLRGGR